MNTFNGTNVRVKDICMIIRVLEVGKEVENSVEIRRDLIPRDDDKVDSKMAMSINDALDKKFPLNVFTLEILERLGFSIEFEFKEVLK